MLLDLSVRRQTYVEDCEVCCNPIEISYAVEDDTLSSFAAKVLESIMEDPGADAIDSAGTDEPAISAQTWRITRTSH